jgi:ABC-type thiamin/hydroxymethylpyrimidine transport system permease subunit
MRPKTTPETHAMLNSVFMVVWLICAVISGSALCGLLLRAAISLVDAVGVPPSAPSGRSARPC